MTNTPLLFTPKTMKSVTFRNRIVIAPMAQYAAVEGKLGDWHLAHLGGFAAGGAGVVFVEATAVEERGRITHGDTGIYTDDHIPPLRRMVDYMEARGAVPAIQIAHSGRKGAMQRPWHGNGPLNEEDFARGDHPWPIVGASPIPIADGWLVPRPLEIAEIPALVENWATAAKRALKAGFKVLEIHSAHGYLLQSFLSPISNQRTDAYGGSLQNRMRLTLEVAEAVRAVWPEDLPLFTRISSVDGVDGGWTLDDSVALAKELKARGVDVVDCSSGGVLGTATAARLKRQPGFQVPYAARIRKEAEIETMAVGLITHPRQAEEILQAGEADLIAIAREALYNPFWPRHAAQAFGVDPEFDDWPDQYGWWLTRRAKFSEFYQEPDDRQAAAE